MSPRRSSVSSPLSARTSACSNITAQAAMSSLSTSAPSRFDARNELPGHIDVTHAVSLGRLNMSILVIFVEGRYDDQVRRLCQLFDELHGSAIGSPIIARHPAVGVARSLLVIQAEIVVSGGDGDDTPLHAGRFRGAVCVRPDPRPISFIGKLERR